MLPKEWKYSHPFYIYKGNYYIKTSNEICQELLKIKFNCILSTQDHIFIYEISPVTIALSKHNESISEFACKGGHAEWRMLLSTAQHKHWCCSEINPFNSSTVSASEEPCGLSKHNASHPFLLLSL